MFYLLASQHALNQVLICTESRKCGKATEQEIKALEESVEKEMEEAVAFAMASPEMAVEEFLQMVEAY